MRHIFNSNAIILAAGVMLCAGYAQAATIGGEVSAVVVEQLTITNQQALNFGHVTPTAGGGSVTVSTGNARTVNGGVQVASSFTRATFKLQGAPNRSYSIHTPESQLFVSSEASSDPVLTNSLTVQNFTTFSVTRGAGGAIGKLSNSGQDDLYLGGTLIVPENAVPGIYSGLVPVTVSY